MLEGDAGIKVEPATSSPAYSMYRFNFLHPPFNDRKIRQAAMYAIGQEDVMKALVGNPKYWRTCASLWAAARRCRRMPARTWWCPRTSTRPARC